ncbi:TIGR03364 family FAD-dependent oxidoreductase [Chitinimonas sp.]|uniref:TIGR03364 family FAD-dependent oxidoreductase n=1 Tax=Chitinimonas sp. TaxID=1934313 RepID=UPI0035B26F6B
MNGHSDVAIVGAGIVGLAHAWAAARRGLSVTVFERDRCARGASVRNFGLGLAVGQAAGEMRELALRSRESWLEILPAAGCWHKAGGSLIVARNQAEWAVLEQFQALRGADYGTRLLGTAQLGEFGLQGCGGLFSASEIALESRRAIPAIASWLAEQYGVRFVRDTQVNSVEGERLETSRGSWQAGRTIICSGHDTQTLLPQAFASLSIRRCALQMLRLANPGLQLAPALMTGLSALHYPAFADCTALAALREQVAQYEPALLEHGIHLIVQQVGEGGELIIGDSHHYDSSPAPFHRELVDTLLLDLARSVLGRPLQVVERWQGIYASGARPFEILQQGETISAVLITAGVGMSIAFALAERQFAH